MCDLIIIGGGFGMFLILMAGLLLFDMLVGVGGVFLCGFGISVILILINGCCVMISVFVCGQESFIDVNFILLVVIEWVEVLLNGVLVIYGVDVVVGVVNYVLCDDYEGQEIFVFYGNFSVDIDEGCFNINGIWGCQYGDYFVMVVVDYYCCNVLFDCDCEIFCNFICLSQQGIYFSFNDFFFMFYDQIEELGEGGCVADDFGFGNFGEFCEVNINVFVFIQDELESWGGLFMYCYQMSDCVEWFNELIYQILMVCGMGFLFNFFCVLIDLENLNWLIVLIDDMVVEGVVLGFDWYYGYLIFVWGKLLDLCVVEVELEILCYVIGFDIELENGWNVEILLFYGCNEWIQCGFSGLVNFENFYNVLLGNLCFDGFMVWCWDVDLICLMVDYFGDICEDDGCMMFWYNLFGGQVNQLAGLCELLEIMAECCGESQFFVFDVIGLGELFEFNGNVVQVVFGVEFCKEEFEDILFGDVVVMLDNLELIFGFFLILVMGECSQWVVFGEFYILVILIFDV